MEQIKDSVVQVRADRTGGSGFIFEVEGSTAFVATNHHVIEDADDISVVVKNKHTYEALLLGADTDRDVAVVSICCNANFVAIPWVSGLIPSEGSEVISIGYPRGSSNQATATIGKIRDADLYSKLYGLIRHTASLHLGSSGGPLLTMDGEVLGINTSRSLSGEIVYYAVPYHAIKTQVEEWKARLIAGPTPIPRSSRGFPTVEAGGSAYTVNEILDPAPEHERFKREGDDKRLIAVDITQAAINDEEPYNPLYFSLQDTDGYVYERGGSLYTAVEPKFGYGELSAGQRVRGWVPFEVPKSAILVAVMAEAEISGPNIIIADLTK